MRVERNGQRGLHRYSRSTSIGEWRLSDASQTFGTARTTAPSWPISHIQHVGSNDRDLSQGNRHELALNAP